jgi:H+-transporting ATPase
MAAPSPAHLPRGFLALLLWTGVATRLLATALAVFGWYLAPLGWQLALLVWGWALVELLGTDPLKVAVYKILDHTGILFKRA